MNKLQLPDGLTSIPEGSIVAIDQFPDTKWVLKFGWYIDDQSSQTLNGWYLSCIPSGFKISLTYKYLTDLTVIDECANNNCCKPEESLPIPSVSEYIPGVKYFRGQLIYNEIGLLYQAVTDFTASYEDISKEDNFNIDVASGNLEEIHKDTPISYGLKWYNGDDTNPKGIGADTDVLVPADSVDEVSQKTAHQRMAEDYDTSILPFKGKQPVSYDAVKTYISSILIKIANDLANYYLKSETYSKEEINQLVSAIPKFSIEPVDELPSENISLTTVYLLKSEESGDNLYTEYIYSHGRWEVLGAQTVDLTGYATEEWTLVKLKLYAKLEGFNPYKFKVENSGYIDIPTRDSLADDEAHYPEFKGYRLVRETAFNELHAFTTILSTQTNSNAIRISDMEEDVQRLSSAYVYKGSVGTYAGLPCGDKVLKTQFSQGHYIELNFPDNAIPKDAAKIRINAKSSTGANYNFVLMGTSNNSYNFYIQKDRYTDETIDISDFDYTTSNGKFRISFTATGGNTLEIDKIYFLNSGGSTVKTIFTADTYAINSKGPVVSSAVSSVSITYKNPDLTAEQKSTLQIGDVYNVSDSDKNYAWNGTDWDSLGGTFSLTNYQSREDTRLKTNSKYIVGAINELKARVDNQAAEVETTLSAILEGEY